MELKTPLYDCHVKAKGKIVPFAGYLLPVQYETGVITEHMAVRQKAGLFDVSHMGEVLFEGKDALANIQKLFTNDFSSLVDGRVRYSPMCNERGGVVDDLIVYRFNANSYLVVINAANRHKDVSHMSDYLFGDVSMRDLSDDMAQIALQGPLAVEILKMLTSEDEIPTKYYSFTIGRVADWPCLISKTGYTGEDGFELYCSPNDAPALWQKLLAVGEPLGLIPCGLGARDTLRLEAAMPLYGHEMDDTITPFETGLGTFVKMNKEDFIGKAALEVQGEATVGRVGIKMTGRGIAREHCAVWADGAIIGQTTSGTHCPYIGAAIAMALVDKQYTQVGQQVEVDVRGRKISAEVVALPFYKASK